MYPVESASANLYKGHVTGLAFPFFPCHAGCTPLQMSTLSEVWWNWTCHFSALVCHPSWSATSHGTLYSAIVPFNFATWQHAIDEQLFFIEIPLDYKHRTNRNPNTCARQKNGLVWVRTDQWSAMMVRKKYISDRSLLSQQASSPL